MKIKGKQLEDTLRTKQKPFTAIHAEDFVGNLNGALRFSGKNDTGSTLNKGQAVYVSGVDVVNAVSSVSLADASNIDAMPAFGVVLSDINNGEVGEIVSFGNVGGLDTSGFSVGDNLYISADTPGSLTTLAPSGADNYLQNIGIVLYSHSSNGYIKVGGAGRTAATPNLDQGKVFIGNASNQSSESTYTLPVSDGTEDQVLTTNGSGAVSFATPSVASYLLFGLSTTLNDQTTQYELATVDGVKNGQGLRLPLSGSVTHITLQADCISLSANRDFTIYLYKNGSQETDTYVTTVTQANVFGNSFTLSTPVSFNASDRLMVKVKHSDTGIQTTQHAITIRVVTSL